MLWLLFAILNNDWMLTYGDLQDPKIAGLTSSESRAVEAQLGHVPTPVACGSTLAAIHTSRWFMSRSQSE